MSIYHQVFVYGTLKRGFGNDYLLTDADFLGPARTLKRYILVDLGAFPAIVLPGHGEGKLTAYVHGELYVVDHDQAARLDRLEGYNPHGGGLYERMATTVVLEDGRLLTARAYYQPRARYYDRGLPPVIKSGHWNGRSREEA